MRWRGNHTLAEQYRADARRKGLEVNQAARERINTLGRPLPRRAGGLKIAAAKMMAALRAEIGAERAAETSGKVDQRP